MSIKPSSSISSTGLGNHETINSHHDNNSNIENVNEDSQESSSPTSYIGQKRRKESTNSDIEGENNSLGQWDSQPTLKAETQNHPVEEIGESKTGKRRKFQA